MIPKEQLKKSVDAAVDTEVAHLIDVLMSNLIDNDKNASGRFRAGLLRVVEAHSIADGVIDAIP